MSFKVVENLCIGCGACDFSCPTGALEKTDCFLGLVAIDPFTCNDCGRGVDKCPERASVVDPAWPVCSGHGCPLTSQRLSDVECSFWQRRCESCGTTLWNQAGGSWQCPKTRHLESAHDRSGPGDFSCQQHRFATQLAFLNPDKES
jgi:NAD-dependent dihydropyrimidine dehydrogenase PreA subunit